MKRALRWTFLFTITITIYFIYCCIAVTFSYRDRVEDGVHCDRHFVCWSLSGYLSKSEYNFRHALDGKGIWVDRAIRFVLAGSIIYIGLTGNPPYSFRLLLYLLVCTACIGEKREQNRFLMIISLNLNKIE